jgi:hypothetical protein
LTNESYLRLTFYVIFKAQMNHPSSSASGNCTAMSLRGSEATEAILQGMDNPEIATLSRQGGIALLTKRGLRHCLLGVNGGKKKR